MHKRILIADDHSAIRSGIKHLLSVELRPVEFQEAVNTSELLDLLTRSGWDILIFDINLPGKNGLQLLKKIRNEGIRVPILVFSSHREDQLAIRCLDAGACGYLSKDAEGSELVAAIKQLLSGRRYISNYVIQQIRSLSTPHANDELQDLLACRVQDCLRDGML
jgi:two-component system, NarL family, invasion response regulator UvrY